MPFTYADARASRPLPPPILKDSRAAEARLFVWPTAGPLCPTDRSLPPSTVKPRRRKAGDAEYDQKECPWVVSSASCVCCLGGRKRGRLEGSREGGQSHVIKLNLILLFPTSPPSPPRRPSASARIPLSAPFHRASRASGAEDLDDQVDQFLGFLPELTSDHSFYRIGNPS